MAPSNWDQPLKIVFLSALAIVFGFIAWQIREIYTPLIIAGLIAYVFSPLIQFTTARTKLSRKAAANIVFFVALTLIILILVMVVPYAFSELGDILKNIDASLLNYQIEYSKPLIFFGRQVLQPSEIIRLMRDSISGDIAVQADQAMALISSTSKGFLWFLVIIVTTYNLMTEWDKLRGWLIGLAPEKYEPELWLLYNEVRVVWLGYLGGQLRLMGILAVLYSIAWVVIGLPGAFLVGIMAGFLNLVPEVGPALAAVVAMMIALLEGSAVLPVSNQLFALITGGTYLVLNNIKTIYIQPKVLGKSVTMHEGVVFVAIIAALLLKGILGVLVVVPVLASVFIITKYLRKKLLGVDPFPLNG